MVLDYLGIHKETDWLWQQLAVDQVTPFPRIITLAAALGIIVDVSTDDHLFLPLIATEGEPVRDIYTGTVSTLFVALTPSEVNLTTTTLTPPEPHPDDIDLLLIELND